MKRNIVLFAIIIAVVAALLVATKTTRKPGASGAINQADFKGKPAPDFELTSIDGKQVKLSDYRGKAVLLNFWATWCPPCKAEMPWFVDLQKQYGNDGLQVVGVAMDDAGKEEIAKFAKDMGVNYPILLGKEGVAQKYGDVQFLPTTFFIDRQGNITDRTFGLVSRSDIESSVKRAMASQTALVSPMAPANTIANSVVPNRGGSR